MKQRLLLFLSALLAVVPLAQARQTPVVVTATNPADGTTGVPLTTLVSFTLDHPIEAETFWDLVEVHPADSIEVDVEGAVVSDDGLTISFEVTHRPQTDYLWVLFGQSYYDEADGAARFVEPFVLRYTTSDAFGTHTVRGTVAFEEATGKSVTVRTPARYEALPFARSHPPESPLTWEALERLGATFQAAGKAGALSVPGPEGTVVVLSTCNLFACEEAGDDGFPFVAATVVTDPSGAYSIPRVREGAYYVFAARFGAHEPLGTDEGGMPDYLGFYDADGDGTPDAIEVMADLDGVDIALFDIMALATTAGPAYEKAAAKAFEIAEDQMLIGVQSGPLTPGGGHGRRMGLRVLFAVDGAGHRRSRQPLLYLGGNGAHRAA
ncbi:MAG: hypothetical protein KatS3mg042_0423 [Rhodothermaceae bacterium]|nr:MAG: hypothetical protein KatS3mg042_0423 [Rhodothermaceae bacterium]